MKLFCSSYSDTVACVYILYSTAMNKFYVGSCLNLGDRFEAHKSKKFGKSFSARSNDWEIYHVVHDLDYEQARLIEKHIKKMKSRKYIEDLKLYPAIIEKLKKLYSGL